MDSEAKIGLIFKNITAYNACQNSWNTSLSFNIFPFSTTPLPPSMMMMYCVVSDKPHAVFPEYTAAGSYAQEIALLWGGGEGAIYCI